MAEFDDDPYAAYAKPAPQAAPPSRGGDDDPFAAYAKAMPTEPLDIQVARRDIARVTAEEQAEKRRRGGDLSQAKIGKNWTDDEIISRLGGDPETVKSSSFYKPGMFNKMISSPGTATSKLEKSWLGRAATGAADFPVGLAQLVAHGGSATGILKPADAALTDIVVRAREANYANLQDGDVSSVDVPRSVGGIVSTLPFGGLGGAAGKEITTQTLAQLAGRGAAMGAAGAAAQPATGDDYAQEKAIQAGVGGTLGGVLPLAALATKWGAGKVAGRLRPEEQAIEDIAARAGQRLTAGEVATAGGREALGAQLGKVETALENIPLSGMAEFREAQHGDTREMVGALNKALRAGREATEFGTGELELVAEKSGKFRDAENQLFALQDKLKTAATPKAKAALQEKVDDAAAAVSALRRESKRSYRADEALKAINMAEESDDWNRLLQADVKQQTLKQKLKSDVLFDAARAEADKRGPISWRSTATDLDEIGGQTTDETALKFLDEMRLRLRRLGPNTNYSKFDDQIRSYAAQAAKDAERAGNGPLNVTASKIANAADRDMQRFAKAPGNSKVASLLNRADEFYKTNVIPLKEGELVKFAEKANPDEAFELVFKKGKGDRAKNFFDRLSPKGQASAREGLIDRATKQATNDKGIVSPAKFAEYLDRMSDVRDVMFRGEDKAMLDNIKTLARAAERGGQYMENPPTGNRIITGLATALAGGATVAAPLPTAAVAGGSFVLSRAMNWLLTSPRGKRLLLSVSDLDADSPRLAKILDEAVSRSSSAAGVTAGKAVE